MTKTNTLSSLLSFIPPWIVIGTVLLLFPIFGYMTFENIHREKRFSTRLLLEKGAALIRSFEAGTRTGMMGPRGGGFQLQRLLVETAQQPDIVYLFVADSDGTVLAHSETGKIGEVISRKNPNLAAIAKTKSVMYRIVESGEGKKIFEVFRQFAPTLGHGWGRGRGHMMHDWMLRGGMADYPPDGSSRQVIFVGLDMTTVEQARVSDTWHTVVMACILLFIGFVGIILLFLTYEYRTTRASLTRIKAFSDTLVENMPIGLVAIDSQKRVATVNNVAEAILCVSFDQVAGKDARSVLPESLWEQISRLSPDRGMLEKEIECELEEDRKMIPLEVSGAPLKDERGNYMGSVMLFKDLSEVRSLRKEIARSQRLAAVGRLAAGVAHEIRNPLSSIKGFATFFRERYKDREEDSQTASIMIQEVDRLNRVVGQLLELARPMSVTKISTKVNDLIEDSVKVIENQCAESNIEIDIHPAEPSIEARVDPDKLQQVLLNLYLNAMESMKETNSEKKLSVSASMATGGGRFQITVSDTGSGIDQDSLSNIFDPFFTTKSTGTGLGLAIVHNIVEAHGGELIVSSRPGEGTIIRLKLPLEDTQ